MVALQPFITLCTQTRVERAKRILEVACGAGSHSLVLASTYLQRGAVLVSTDFSAEMMVLAKKRFDDKEISQSYTSNPANKYHIIADEVLPLGDHSFDIEQALKEQNIEATDRFVLGCQANNESLPFKDGSFDCYLANLSLMLVDNHHNQLTEAHRVTKPGSSLAFTVWGRESKINNFSIMKEVYEIHGLGPKEQPAKTNYDLGKDPLKLKAEFEQHGFTNVRMWYQQMNTPYTDFEDYYQTIFHQPTSLAILNSLDEVKKAEVLATARKLYDERMGPSNLDPECFEVMIVTC